MVPVCFRRDCHRLWVASLVNGKAVVRFGVRTVLNRMLMVLNLCAAFLVIIAISGSGQPSFWSLCRR